jgi:hypothetical protein
LRTPERKRELGSAWTSGETQRTRKLNEVSGAQNVGIFEEEWADIIENIIEPIVGREGQLCCIEYKDRAICSSTPCYWVNSDGIMEYETKSAVSRITALIGEQVIEQIIGDGDQESAFFGHRCTLFNAQTEDERKGKYEGGETFLECHWIGDVLE